MRRSKRPGSPPEPRAPGGPAGAVRTAFPRALTLLHVRGVPVRLHLSWVLLAGLVVWVFGTRFQQLLWAYPDPVTAGAAVVATVLFLASIVAHELGHALTSLHRGVPVSAITLFLLGGVTESTREPSRPRDELAIVGAGPFVSLVLASAFGLLHSFAPGQTPYGVVTGYLAWTNLAVTVVNLLPALPLDGGRLLRGALWSLGVGQQPAARWAANTGLALAGALVAVGAYGLASGPLPRLAGPLLRVLLLLAENGVLSILVGVSLAHGAWGARRRARLREALTSRTARDAAEPLPAVVPPELRGHLDPVAPDLAAPDPFDSREEAETEAQSGSAGASEATGEPSEASADWTRVPPIARIAADAPLDEALEAVVASPARMVVVTEGERIVGILTVRGIGGALT